MKFEFTEQEAQKILSALIKEPYIEVADVINKMQAQAAEQMQEKEIS